MGGSEEGRAPRNEELLTALEIYSFEVSQKTDLAKLGITTASQAPSEFISAPKKHLLIRGHLIFCFILNTVVVARVWGAKGMGP